MSKIKVAVMNTSQDLTDILEEVLREEGFETAAIFTRDIKDEEKNFDRFIREEKPAVVVYDIALPYEENYLLFKRLIKRKSAKDIAFVLTTTNKKVLDLLVGPTNAYEVIGKPYDLEEIVTAVKLAHETKNLKILPIQN